MNALYRTTPPRHTHTLDLPLLREQVKSPFKGLRVQVEDLENSCQLFFLLRSLSLHSICKSCNCSGVGCLHFIPEELFWKNLNFPWQSCAGKHWVKCSRIAESSPLKDYRSKFVSRLPPIYILLSNGNQISFQGPCSINTYSAFGKHMQLNFHHNRQEKKKIGAVCQRSLVNGKPRTVQACYWAYLV